MSAASFWAVMKFSACSRVAACCSAAAIQGAFAVSLKLDGPRGTIRIVMWPFRRGGADGFRMESSGRSGVIAFREAGRALSIGWEMSGSPDFDILLAPMDLRRWSVPAGEAIVLETQLELLGRLRAWLRQEGIRSDIDVTGEGRQTDVACAQAGCAAGQRVGSAFCPTHADLRLLVVDE